LKVAFSGLDIVVAQYTTQCSARWLSKLPSPEEERRGSRLECVWYSVCLCVKLFGFGKQHREREREREKEREREREREREGERIRRIASLKCSSHPLLKRDSTLAKIVSSLLV